MHHTTSDKLFDLVNILPNEEQSPYYDYLFVEYKNKKISKKFFSNKSLPWYKRYSEQLPFKSKNILSLGEGNTPIVNSKKFSNCFFKEEGRNPSGCFKDREHAVLMPYLKENGVKDVVIVSSGNAALSASLYGNIYGIKVKCVIPRRTSKGKQQLIKMFGGSLTIGGEDFEECYRWVADSKKFRNTINISAGINSLKDQGTKIIAFEIFDELSIPDYIVIPSANGSLLFGIYQGFKEIQKIMKREKMPKLIAVQMKNSDPLKQALLKGRKDYYDYKNADLTSLAEGIVAKESFCSPKALYALRKSKGFVCTISQKELNMGMAYAIKEEGLLPEWTAASGFAALLKLQKKHLIPTGSKTVIINTGSGLKEIDHIAEFIK